MRVAEGRWKVIPTSVKKRTKTWEGCSFLYFRAFSCDEGAKSRIVDFTVNSQSDWPNIYQKSTQNRSQIGPKSFQNRSQIGPKWIQNRSWNRPRSQHRFWTVLGPILDPTWGHLGGLLGLKLGSSWAKNRLLEVLDGVQKRTWFLIPFRTDFGTILERFGGPKSTQNRSRIGLKSEQARKAKMFKKPLVFQCFLCLRGVENQSKIDQKSFPKIS